MPNSSNKIHWIFQHSIRSMLLLTALIALVVFALSRPRDIIEYASAHPTGSMIVTLEDGTDYVAKYGDYDLEKAEELLSNDFERPWTLEKVLDWYRRAQRPEIRSALLRVMAASRDERAIPVLGRALDDNSVDIRISATDSLIHYYISTPIVGGTEHQMAAARKFWKNYERKQSNPNTN